MISSFKKPTPESLRSGMPITLELAATQFVGVVEHASTVAHNDSMLVTIYYATTSGFSRLLPARVPAPHISSRIRWNQLRFRSSVEYDRLMWAQRPRTKQSTSLVLDCLSSCVHLSPGCCSRGKIRGLPRRPLASLWSSSGGHKPTRTNKQR